MDYRIIIVSIIVMILIGALSKKIGLLKENDVETLNNIVINIALPCMIFNALYTADVSLLPRLSGQEENLEFGHRCCFRKYRFFRISYHSRNLW